MPATPADAKGLLTASIRDPNPVVFIEHKMLYNTRGPVPEGEHLVPLGVADIKRPGGDVSIVATSRMVLEALRAGADAYLLKEGPSRHLSEAITFVRDGGVWISPLLRGAGLFTRGEKSHAEDPLASLSPREMEVFSYLVNGLRAKDIADLLDISPKTVDTYWASLMRKLNVHDLVGLVKFAIERNLTSTAVTRRP
jgi:DNA-binding CsgD family transcriptional regulator